MSEARGFRDLQRDTSLEDVRLYQRRVSVTDIKRWVTGRYVEWLSWLPAYERGGWLVYLGEMIEAHMGKEALDELRDVINGRYERGGW